MYTIPLCVSVNHHFPINLLSSDEPLFCLRGHVLELYKAPQSWLDEKESDRLKAAADK